MASSVISAPGASRHADPIASITAATVSGRHQARRAAAEEHRVDPPPGHLAPPRPRISATSAARQRSWSTAAAHMAVEIAIGALRRAERPVDVDAETAGAPVLDRDAAPSAKAGRPRNCAKACGAVADPVLLGGGPSRRASARVPAGLEHRVVAVALRRRASARRSGPRPRPRTPRPARPARPAPACSETAPSAARAPRPRSSSSQARVIACDEVPPAGVVAQSAV